MVNCKRYELLELLVEKFTCDQHAQEFYIHSKRAYEGVAEHELAEKWQLCSNNCTTSMIINSVSDTTEFNGCLLTGTKFITKLIVV